MAADYPSSITTLYSDVVSGQIIDITHINRLKEEIVAIETELGTSPSGSYSDVKTKLNEVDLENRLTISDMAQDDLISIYDDSASDNKAIAYSNFFPDSEWRAHGFPGNPSTATNIARFTTVVKNVDTLGAWTITNDSTNGCKVVIDIAGVYSITFWGEGVASTQELGLSLNSTAVTTNIAAVSAADILCYDAESSGQGCSVHWIGSLAVNDYVRPHKNSNSLNSTNCGFTIKRLS